MKLPLILIFMTTSFFTWAGPRVVGNGFLEDKETPTTEVETNLKTAKEDKIDYPFVNDPQISKTQWCSVDLVNKIVSFDMGPREWKEDLYLHKINFLPNGALCWDYEYKEKKCRPNESLTYLKWTKVNYEQFGVTFDGVITHKGDATASGYLLKRIQGQLFLFLQHKSGDYKSKGKVPNYFVFKSCSLSEKK